MYLCAGSHILKWQHLYILHPCSSCQVLCIKCLLLVKVSNSKTKTLDFKSWSINILNTYRTLSSWDHEYAVTWLDHLFPVACSPYCKRREAGQEARKLLEHLLEIFKWVMSSVAISLQWPTCMVRSRDTAGGQGPWNHHRKCMESTDSTVQSQL